MNRLLPILFLLFFYCLSYAQDSKIVNYEELKEIIYQDNNKLYVINFWATWCKPCLEEMPDLMAIDKEFKNKSNYQMILVSLDLAKNKKRVDAYLRKNNIQNQVLILDDNKRMDLYISKTNANWSGALPATILIKNKKSLYFVENKFNPTILKNQIQNNLK